MIARNHVGNGSSAVLRRDCLDQAGLFNTDLRACEDYELWCRILGTTTYRAQLVPEVLTLYRMRHASLSYDHATFVAQADAAMRLLRTALPHVPRTVFDRGQAGHYRIAAWKAATSGETRASARLLLRALRLRPGFILRDRRALANAVWLLLPRWVRLRLWGGGDEGRQAAFLLKKKQRLFSVCIRLTRKFTLS